MILNLEDLELAMQSLLHQSPWQGAQAGSMLMIQFGDRMQEQKRSGRYVEVGSLSLHVQCPWRVRKASVGIIAGCEDDNLDAFQAWCAAAPKVAATRPDRHGGLALDFADESIFEVFPATSRTDIHAEAWRLIANGGGRKLHLVVGGYGAEIDDGFLHEAGDRR